MHRRHIAAALMILAAVFAALPAFAMDGGDYAAGSGTKLGRGVVNGATGWMEVPKQTAIGGQEAGVPGVVGGFFKGVAMGVARTVVGAVEIATFWAPVPERFEPALKPATVFEDR